MGISTSAGALIAIGTTATNPVGDTYVNIGQVSTIPEFGRVYNEIKFNPLSTRGTLKFKGSFDDGSIAVAMGKDLGDAGQAAVLVARDVDADYNFQVTANDALPVATNAAIAITVAAPGVVTWTAHGFPAGTAIKFTVGTLPTGLSLATTYFICAGATLLTNTFTVAATLAAALAGTGITTTGSPGSSITGVTVPAPTTLQMKAKVLSYTTKFDTLDNVVMSTMNLSIKSGSIVETVHLP